MDLKQHLMQNSPSDLYEAIKKSKEKISKKSVVVLTSRNDESKDNGLFRTAKKISEICQSRRIPCYSAFVETSFIKKDESGIKTIHNYDDKHGFIVDPFNTVVIIRGSVARSKSTMDMITQLERDNIFCVNSRNCLEICGDKYRTVLALSDAGIISPKTALVQNKGNLEYSFESIGGKFPVILKTLSGSKGVGVFFAESWKSFRPMLDTIWKINEEEEILIQQYIEAPYDIRVHVLGEEVIASMKRIVIDNDFRSNFSLGGKTAKIKISDEQKEICIKAAKAVGAVWCGVDLIVDKKGNTYVLEVNSSPGTEGIEKTTGLPVTNTVLDNVLNEDNWMKVYRECGYLETLDIEGIGPVQAKMDTGNSNFNVLHSDGHKINGNNVEWTTNGKKMVRPLKKIKDAKLGGLKDGTEDRPIIELDVFFGGITYKSVNFALSNRDGRASIALMNRSFLRKACVMVHPGKEFVMSIKEEKV